MTLDYRKETHRNRCNTIEMMKIFWCSATTPKIYKQIMITQVKQVTALDTRNRHTAKPISQTFIHSSLHSKFKNEGNQKKKKNSYMKIICLHFGYRLPAIGLLKNESTMDRPRNGRVDWRLFRWRALKPIFCRCSKFSSAVQLVFGPPSLIFTAL